MAVPALESLRLSPIEEFDASDLSLYEPGPREMRALGGG